jgi:hypothetical protein
LLKTRENILHVCGKGEVRVREQDGVICILQADDTPRANVSTKTFDKPASGISSFSKHYGEEIYNLIKKERRQG